MFNFIMDNKEKPTTPVSWKDSFSDTSSGYFSAMDHTEFDDMGFKTEAKNMQSRPHDYHVTESAPLSITNNVVLQQPNSRSPKHWNFNSSAETFPQSPVVLFQPVVPNNCTQTSAPSTLESQSKYYITNFNSYLNNTPQPTCRSKGHRKRISSRSHSGKHRRHHRNNEQPVCSISNSDVTSAVSSSVDSHIFSHGVSDTNSKNTAANLPDLHEPSVTNTPISLYSNTCSVFSQSPEAEYLLETLSPSLSKRKRFCNTYNVLNQSGLLGITMRTKELIRQNKRSQAQLQKLQAHTDLFLEAISSRDPQIWAKLQLTFQNVTEELKEDLVENTLSCM